VAPAASNVAMVVVLAPVTERQRQAIDRRRGSGHARLRGGGPRSSDLTPGRRRSSASRPSAPGIAQPARGRNPRRDQRRPAHRPALRPYMAGIFGRIDLYHEAVRVVEFE